MGALPTSGLGFGPADWLEFFIGCLLVAAAFLWTPWLQDRTARFAGRTKLIMLCLFALPIALRLLLLPHHPTPIPSIYDEFSHLLVADTLLHGRLANPPHPLHRFFETFFVLQRPTYSSIYPPGQGLMLAGGRLLAGTPWAGVLVVGGCFCAACFWMLRAYVSPAWALLGGLLAVFQFGPLNLWMNCYWGGMLPAAAGCLAFGSLGRTRAALKLYLPPRRLDLLLLGTGFGAHLLTRPFESLLLAACIVLYLTPLLGSYARIVLLWRVLPAATPALLALLLLVLQNKQVTGSWVTLPEALSQYQYGVPTTLTVQRPATPHNGLTPQQALEYRSQLLMHGPDRDSPRRFFLRLQYRVRDYRFFFLPPLYLAVFAFLFTLRQPASALAAGALLIFALGTNLFPYLLVHYLAGVTCLFVLVSILGLQQIAQLRISGFDIGDRIVRVIVLLASAQFLLWYTLHLCEGADGAPVLLQYETWDSIGHSGPNARAEVAARLSLISGKLLVFVHYGEHHVFQNEWVWNAADIERARIVFARDRGAEENKALMRYYPHRKLLILDPDAQPPTLEPLARTSE